MNQTASKPARIDQGWGTYEHHTAAINDHAERLEGLSYQILQLRQQLVNLETHIDALVAWFNESQKTLLSIDGDVGDIQRLLRTSTFRQRLRWLVTGR